MPLFCHKNGLSTSAQSISDWSNPSLSYVVDLIAQNPDDIDVIKSSVDLFWTLLFVCHIGFLEIFAPKFLHHLFISLARFPVDKQLKIGVLILLQNLRKQLKQKCASPKAVVPVFHGLGGIISSMEQHFTNPSVQSSLCLVLESQMIFEGFDVRVFISNKSSSKALCALCDTAETHASNIDVIRNA